MLPGSALALFSIYEVTVVGDFVDQNSEFDLVRN